MIKKEDIDGGDGLYCQTLSEAGMDRRRKEQRGPFPEAALFLPGSGNLPEGNNAAFS